MKVRKLAVGHGMRPLLVAIGSHSRIQGVRVLARPRIRGFPCLYYTEYSDSCIFSPAQPNTENFCLLPK